MAEIAVKLLYLFSRKNVSRLWTWFSLTLWFVFSTAIWFSPTKHRNSVQYTTPGNQKFGVLQREPDVVTTFQAVKKVDLEAEKNGDIEKKTEILQYWKTRNIWINQNSIFGFIYIIFLCVSKCCINESTHLKKNMLYCMYKWLFLPSTLKGEKICMTFVSGAWWKKLGPKPRTMDDFTPWVCEVSKHVLKKRHVILSHPASKIFAILKLSHLKS